ncbi:hypothetical protein KQI42_09855 [Tissierella sp. MSJ-40]|uniref:Zinc ribbon domain-containing protein n=1 Tax=Tissierella simiarum TaxID=2841534 RepID=A0ABS6E5W3_9FIRM|nr:hypothetical protein [Tissierella simiarum]MBU5438314.1 hypothetical protein [Tissierella simiarum]
MEIDKCINCGEPVPEVLQICPQCMRESGASEEEIKIAEELRDIANILNITADACENIKAAMQSILNIAERLEGREE